MAGSKRDRAFGSLYGLAFGDALGAATEFMRFGEILDRFPPAGPLELAGDPVRVTDDTQMALAVGEALLESPRPSTVAGLEGPLRRAFVAWYGDPDNDRAPGMTCLRACENLMDDGRPWHEATIATSKGCGANMRVAPVGLLATEQNGQPERTRAPAAQFQAALTHGHPTALAASDLTAAAVHDLATGGDAAGLPGRLRAYAEGQRTVYHEGWLGPLWQRPWVRSPEEFIARGWDECLGVLDRLDAALASPDREADPCLFTGEGWVAEEALGTGLLCFLFFPDDPVAAIRRAAASSGDSDSIACLTGAFAGAYAGMDAWPKGWVQRIEYRDRLETLGTAWNRGG